MNPMNTRRNKTVPPRVAARPDPKAWDPDEPNYAPLMEAVCASRRALVRTRSSGCVFSRSMNAWMSGR